MRRWSLVFIAAFVAVLIVGSILIELSGFDIRKVLVLLGWAFWMVDAARAQRARVAPAVARPSEAVAPTARCANCGAPRRTDGLAFCSDCGPPTARSGHENSLAARDLLAARCGPLRL